MVKHFILSKPVRCFSCFKRFYACFDYGRSFSSLRTLQVTPSVLCTWDVDFMQEHLVRIAQNEEDVTTHCNINFSTCLHMRDIATVTLSAWFHSESSDGYTETGPFNLLYQALDKVPASLLVPQHNFRLQPFTQTDSELTTAFSKSYRRTNKAVHNCYFPFMVEIGLGLGQPTNKK